MKTEWDQVITFQADSTPFHMEVQNWREIDSDVREDHLEPVQVFWTQLLSTHMEWGLK